MPQGYSPVGVCSPFKLSGGTIWNPLMPAQRGKACCWGWNGTEACKEWDKWLCSVSNVTNVFYILQGNFWLVSAYLPENDNEIKGFSILETRLCVRSLHNKRPSVVRNPPFAHFSTRNPFHGDWVNGCSDGLNGERYWFLWWGSWCTELWMDLVSHALPKGWKWWKLDRGTLPHYCAYYTQGLFGLGLQPGLFVNTNLLMKRDFIISETASTTTSEAAFTMFPAALLARSETTLNVQLKNVHLTRMCLSVGIHLWF